jgi:hypothetical protein
MQKVFGILSTIIKKNGHFKGEKDENKLTNR